MTGAVAAELTNDAFLGGRLCLWQPRKGYRAGIDPVLLAASVPARAGQTVLDLGCGAGAAALCLLTRVPDLVVTGVECQHDYAALARRNADENGLTLEVVNADLADLPPAIRQRHFDHVIANPPYYRPGTRSPAGDPGREAGRAETTPLSDWISAAARRLTPGGWLHVIQRVERLPELLTACAGRIGGLEILPLAARQNRDPHLVILRGRKGARSAFRLLRPVALHVGDVHEKDGDSYTLEISSVLRDAAAFEWPGSAAKSGRV